MRRLKLGAIGAALAVTACAGSACRGDWLAPATPAAWALPVEVATEPAFDAVVLPTRGSYAQHPASMARLREYLRASGRSPAGPAFGRYFNDPAQVSESELRWEVGLPVAEAFAVAPPFELRRFPATLVARLVLDGPYRSNARFWPALHSWIGANGYVNLGPGTETWSGDPTKAGDAGPRSELRIPVGELSVSLQVLRDATCLFGACLFALFLYLYLHGARARVSRWGGSVWGLIGLAWLCLYLEPLAWNVVYLFGDASPWILWFARWSASVNFVAAPLLVHLFYYKGRGQVRHRRLWASAVVLVYVVSAAWMGLRFVRPEAAALSPAGQVEHGLFAGAAAVSLLIQHASRRGGGRLAGRAEHLTYCVVLLCIALSLAVQAAVPPGAMVGVLANLVLLASPIVLLFVAAYHNERAAFFDVLAKAGSFLFLALVLMTAWFALAPRLLTSVRMGWVGLWLYPLAFLPLVLAAPRAERRLAALVDRHVLGRRYTPAEAGQHFFPALRGLAGEAEVLRVAEAELAGIFQAPVRITTTDDVDPAGDGGTDLVAPLRAGNSVIGAVRVDAARGRRRLLSEDEALLAALAEGLSFLLDNARLQEKRRAQEVKERELALQASRSELRALRAQINPHFLFNALNTIAALIPRAPDRAEESVERLAEVFRYALRGSEAEWARVEDEMTFVGAYLDLERTRFAERLEVRLHVEDGAGDGLIPAMSVQTLVENAVKHGIAALRGRGRVEVDVRRCGERLRVEVCDTGPGFSLARALAAPASPRGGRGLRNVRDRLQGYFGARAEMTCERDAELTRVVLVLPFLAEAPEAAQR